MWKHSSRTGFRSGVFPSMNRWTKGMTNEMVKEMAKVMAKEMAKVMAKIMNKVMMGVMCKTISHRVQNMMAVIRDLIRII